MQNNYHFLTLLTSSLETKLGGAVISECFTQEKDECLLRFETTAGPFFIRASLSASFACLSFPKDFNRAKRNSVDLFPLIIGERVRAVQQTPYDRSFTLLLSNDHSLLFKMHSNRANLILYQDQKVIDVFRKKIKQDWLLEKGSLVRQVDFSYENFLKNQKELRALYFTFGKVIWQYLDLKNFPAMGTDDQWKAIQDLLNYLAQPNYYIATIDGKLTFSLVSTGKIVREYKDALSALTDFYQNYVQQSVFELERGSLHLIIKKKIQAFNNFRQKSSERLASIKAENNFKVWADLLMANLHALSPGIERVILPDFYNNNTPIEIKLKREFSPQKNAEIYYGKSKKQQLEVDHITKMLSEKEAGLAEANEALITLENTTDLRRLRALSEKYRTSISDNDDEPLPFHEVEFRGYRILVGKNAQSNDKMLQGYSYKEDLWLHAKDVAGSHVLIKYQSGKQFPKDVIERAAQIAAFHSKRKTESLCPVIVTPRKYVRKRKGDPAGTVVIERESVILVGKNYEL